MAAESTELIERWPAKRRVALAVRLLKGGTSGAEAARTHGLTVAEVEDWREKFLKEKRFRFGFQMSHRYRYLFDQWITLVLKRQILMMGQKIYGSGKRQGQEKECPARMSSREFWFDSPARFALSELIYLLQHCIKGRREASSMWRLEQKCS